MLPNCVNVTPAMCEYYKDPFFAWGNFIVNFAICTEHIEGLKCCFSRAHSVQKYEDKARQQAFVFPSLMPILPSAGDRTKYTRGLKSTECFTWTPMGLNTTMFWWLTWTNMKFLLQYDICRMKTTQHTLFYTHWNHRMKYSVNSCWNQRDVVSSHCLTGWHISVSTKSYGGSVSSLRKLGSLAYLIHKCLILILAFIMFCLYKVYV